MKHINKYRLITFLYLLVLFALIEVSIRVFNVDNFYVRLLILFPFVMLLQGPYDKALKTLAQVKMEKFEKTCKIDDVEDYITFLSKRHKTILSKKRRYAALFFFYLTSFYAYNNEFEHSEKLLDFINENEKYNSNKIQILNIEILKEAIKGDFEKVEDLYIELSYCIDTEIAKSMSNPNQIALFNQIKLVLGKFVELTKNVNEETIANARLWINHKTNLYNAIDNYCILKILEHHNNVEYIDEFKDNLRKIGGDIAFLKID